MSDAGDFLKRLRESGVNLVTDGQTIKCQSELAPGNKTFLQQNRDHVIQLLLALQTFPGARLAKPGEGTNWGPTQKERDAREALRILQSNSRANPEWWPEPMRSALAKCRANLGLVNMVDGPKSLLKRTR